MWTLMVVVWFPRPIHVIIPPKANLLSVVVLQKRKPTSVIVGYKVKVPLFKMIDIIRIPNRGWGFLLMFMPYQ